MAPVMNQLASATLNTSAPADAAAYANQRCSTPNAAVKTASANAAASMSISKTSLEFEKLFLPHLDPAYNLARLLLRDAQDAEDVVQEAYLKALRAFSGFHGESGRPWLRANRSRGDHAEYHEEIHVSGGATPEAESLGKERSQAIGHCVEQLPPDFREAIVLREMEDPSYNEIAEITGVPRGAVMSRLSRARARLSECLKSTVSKQAGERRASDLR